MRGYGRRGQGSGFKYFDAQGKRVATRAQLSRMKSLAIPPACKDVWICPDANGHLQATGRLEAWLLRKARLNLIGTFLAKKGLPG
jgi:DNA topoisomerase IB